MNKTGIELSLNTIIIALLSLVVLVVLMFILTKGSNIFSTSALSCEAKGGKCLPDKECNYQKTSFSCSKKEEVCCINPLKS